MSTPSLRETKQNAYLWRLTCSYLTTSVQHREKLLGSRIRQEKGIHVTYNGNNQKCLS